MNSEPDEGDSKTLIYGTSHCHWMVGHGIQHSRDVWVIANRFFDSYKNLKGLPPLNDKEKYCLSCAIWLHDIGMSTMMAPIGGQIGRLKGFWNGKNNLNGEFPQKLTQNLIRKYHSFLSRFFIINPIPISKSNPINNINDELKECIAIICCYHQSKWKFYNEPGNNYFGTLTSESINQKILIFGKYRTDGDVDINILYLSALLRFFDECDQIKSRVGDGDVIQQNTINELHLKYDEIIKLLNENDNLRDRWELCKPPDIYTMSKDESKENFEKFESLLNDPQNYEAKSKILTDSYELYKSISIETHSHFIAKVILDIGFGIENGNTIIKIQCDPNDQYIKDFKTGVIENLKICQRFFSSNPTINENNLFNLDDLFRCSSEDNTQWVCDSTTERELRESKKKKNEFPADNPDYTSLPVIDFTDFCENYVKQFTGREWLYKDINTFFKANNSKNIYAIIAPKGFGKTAIACQAREKIECCKDIHICHSSNPSSCNPILWINRIIRCLAENDAPFREHINKKILTYDENIEKNPAEYFSHFFSDYPRISEDKFFVFVIDGLDEADARSGGADKSFNSFFKYQTFPTYIKILITSRPGIMIGGERTKDRIETKEMKPDLQDNLFNLKEYIRNRIKNLDSGISGEQQENYTNNLCNKSAGIFLYAKIILDAIEGGFFLFDNIDNLPQELSKVYNEMFDCRFSTEVNNDLPSYDECKNLLTVYCTNYYIPDTLIKQLERERKLNTKHQKLIQQFLIRSGQNCRFFHESMREWLLSEGKYTVQDEYVSINSDICNICKGKFDDEYLGAYSRINLFQHFMNANRHKDASDLLKNPEYLILKIKNNEFYELLSDFRVMFSSSEDRDEDLTKILNFLIQRSYVLKKNPGLVEQEIVNFGPKCIGFNENQITNRWLELENKRHLLYDQLLDDHRGPITKTELINNFLFAIGYGINSQFSSSYISLWDLESGRYDRISLSDEHEQEPIAIKSFCVSACDNNSISIVCGLDNCKIIKIQYNITYKKIETQQPISIQHSNENPLKIQDIRHCSGTIICSIGEYASDRNRRVSDNEAGSQPVYPQNNYLYVFTDDSTDPRIIDTKKIVNCIEIYKENVLLGCKDGTIGVFNIQNQNPQYKEIHKNSVNCIAIQNNGVATSGDDKGYICRWMIDPFIDLKNAFDLINKNYERKALFSLIHYTGNDNAQYLIAAGSGDLYLIKDISERPKIFRVLFLTHKKKISSLIILNGRYLLSGSNDSLIKMWDLDKIFTPRPEQDDYESKLIDVANILLKSANGDYLIFASTYQSEHAVKIWKYDEGKYKFYKQIVSDNHVKSLTFLDQNHLVLCDTHGGILQCNIDSDNRFHSVVHISSPIQCIDCCDNNKICVATQSNHIRFIDVADRKIGNSWVFLGSIENLPLFLFDPNCFARNGELRDIKINIYDHIKVLKLINDYGFIAGSKKGLLILFQNDTITSHELNVNILDIFIVQPFLIVPCRDIDDYQIHIYNTQVELNKRISLGYTALTQSDDIALSVLKYTDQICLWYSSSSNIFEYWLSENTGPPHRTNISISGKITLNSFELNHSFYLVVGGKNDLKVWKRENQGNYILSASFNFETEVVNCIYLLKENQPYLICGTSGGDISILKLKNFGA